MSNKVQDLFNEIRRLEGELSEALEQRQQELSYDIKERVIHFQEEVVEQHKREMVRLGVYLRRARWRNILTAPMIWLNLFPALLIDLVVSLFQWVCFPVYGIPRVKRRDYIVIDRQNLKYLNIIEKINCVYCGYFNGVIAYVREVAARTEQYWCPIKHAQKMQSVHSRYSKFADFGDSEQFHEDFAARRSDFDDIHAPNAKVSDGADIEPRHNDARSESAADPSGACGVPESKQDRDGA